MKYSAIVLFVLFVGVITFQNLSGGNLPSWGKENPYLLRFLPPVKPQVSRDTLPAIKERKDNFSIAKPVNIIDLKDPSIIDKKVTYDPITNKYIMTEKIGEDDFQYPSYMSFDQYLKKREVEDYQKYFRQLAGIGSENNSGSLNPLSTVDVKASLIDRLFGGNSIDIRPQGGVDLTFGMDYQSMENPFIIEAGRRQLLFDFDMNIQMNITGKIGDKLNLATNYNTNATFDVDKQVIKLNYNSDLFNEDEIVKKIEAGNVSLPLRGSLIQGAESLFGLKTELQFGHLRLTAIASQQRSQRKNIQTQGGSQVQEFEVRADQYDENRHFFLSHYNRSAFEPALENLPQIRSLFKLENIEVWLTNDRNEVDNVRDIVALADLGEPEILVNPTAVPVQTAFAPKDLTGKPLPDNSSNNLYNRVISDPRIRQIDNAVSILQSEFKLNQSRDFEKVSARKLRPSEYNVHSELGFVTLNINVQPDQVVGVAYQYSYNGKTFKVGELANNSENTKPDSSLTVLFVKMLKSTTQTTDVPTWDLMMKNIYPIGAVQIDQNEFRLDIFYEDPGKGLKRFLPETNLAGRPLLRVFNVDKLNTQGDPTPDGIFDFVPGLTINLSNGRVMFPVLEPFGGSLAKQIEDVGLRAKYTFPELYSKTLFLAQEYQEKNRFVIKGNYKSSVSSEISLGAFNIPPGSVTVSGGGQTLREGVDYEIDYNIGRVRILNDAILNSGIPVNVSYEDNGLFNFQTKSMFGVRADYAVDKNFNIGATALKLFERPFTQKVNIGEDPINNSIYGFDLGISRDAPFLTKIVDALPGISTKAKSSINFTGETALIRPGHSRAINQNSKDKGGVVYIDDFEGSASSLDLRQPVTNWVLASVPQNDAFNNNPLFPEASLVNDLRYGSNRAKLSWYRIDLGARGTDQDAKNPYTSQVPQIEVFPNAQIAPNQLPNIPTFDMTYYPENRGPYNFDVPGGYPGISKGAKFIGDSMVLDNPGSRWAGVMRALNTNDFQSSNIEFLEFWVLSPFLDPADPKKPVDNYEKKQGELYINLGNVSEDILRDSRKFFENGLPAPLNPSRRTDNTNWSVIPVAQQITNAFDIDEASRLAQDIGLDGMNDATEAEKFAPYLSSIAKSNPRASEKLKSDPAADNFRNFNDPSYTQNIDLLSRYKDFNGPEGNSKSNSGGNQLQSATNVPDAEDLNRDNTLNETEAYFQYKIPILADPLNPREIDVNRTPFVTDRIESDNGERIWYRLRVPLNGNDKVAVGGIKDFRSIRFMRMYLHGFESEVTFRFARMELVRNQWRRYSQDLNEQNNVPCDAQTQFDVDAVNIEENSNRKPFSYVLPVGIQRQQALGVFNTLQNEQSLTMKIKGLCEREEKAVFKNVGLDMRVYDRIKAFVHAEKVVGPNLNDGDVSVFIRIGSDFKNNYYEYEIPVRFSDDKRLPANIISDDYKQEVWRPENEFDVALSLFTDLKIKRNDAGFSLTDEYGQIVDGTGTVGNPEMQHRISIKGNPSLGLAKIAMIGVRNRNGGQISPVNVELWINELRLTGLDERGGVAAIGRLDMQLADLGNVSLAGNYASIGFGAIDQRVLQRNREAITGFDVSGSIELNKFLPASWGIKLPLFAQYSTNFTTPEFDPFDLDIRLKDKLPTFPSLADRDSIKRLSREINSIQGYNFTNIRKERTGGPSGQPGNPAPWDISNFSFNYAFTKTDKRSPLIEFDESVRRTGSLNYAFSRKGDFIQPFKNLKGSALKWISEINFNPLPNSFTFGTQMARLFNTTRYRFTGLEDRYNTFFNKRFSWDREYNVNWDLTKAIKFTFSASNFAVIDEPDEVRLLENYNIETATQIRKDSIWSNIQQLGRSKTYQHSFTLGYTLPFRVIPFMDWITSRVQYQGQYGWNAAALNLDSLGNQIRNSQNIQANIDFNFESIYSKIPYLRKIDRGAPATKSKKSKDDNQNQEPAQPEEKEKKGSEPSMAERMLIRPFLLLRRARFNYTLQSSTVVPGFMPAAKLMGMGPDFQGPGWDFVAGLQPKISELSDAENYTASDWLNEIAKKGWISSSVFLNQEVAQSRAENYDGRLTVEPFKEFRIELEFNKNFSSNHSQFFKDTTLNNSTVFSHAIPKDIGTMTMSYSALKTLFNQDKDDLVNLFKQFETNRIAVSMRLGEGTHLDTTLAKNGYSYGYGRTQQDVLIPAFIAAYTGADANSIPLDIFGLLPNINWRLQYNGLAKVPLFSELFQNFSLTHGYKSTLTVSRFNSGLDFIRTQSSGALNELNGNFYARLEIPEVAIQEGFSPLIAVDATLKNGMSLNVNYKVNRLLAMSFVSNQLSETRSKEFVIGFGYLLRNLDIPFLTGSKKKGGGRPVPKTTDPMGNTDPAGRNTAAQGNDLDITFNLSMRDDVTFNHLLDQGIIEPTRGNYSLTFSPSAEYKISRQLSLRAFFDYRKNRPKTSAGFPRTDASGGFILRFTL